MKYNFRCLVFQTILMHIALNDMYKSHKTETNSFDSWFRDDKLIIIIWKINFQIILNLILYLYLIKWIIKYI